MEIIKLLKDYSRTPLEYDFSNAISSELQSAICREPIKNKEFMIRYIQPVNNFIIHTTATAGSNIKRVLY